MKFWSNPKWYWLRWVLVLPVAVLAMVFGELIFNLVNYLNVWFLGWKEDSPYIFLVNIGAAGIGGFYCIYFGAITAPQRQKVTSLVLLIILVGILGYTVIANIHLSQYKAMILALSSIVGAALSYFKFQEEVNEV